MSKVDKSIIFSNRIQSLVDRLGAKTYLEIGVFEGKTFNKINVAYKIAVDPNFTFDVNDYTSENCVFYSETSDNFFAAFSERSKALVDKYGNQEFKFDVIFLDGLHEYEQTLRDFENSLLYSHDKTVWIFDDTLPCHSFSAMNDQAKSLELRSYADMSSDRRWHGDVFKVIFDIHDNFQEFSYCTQYDNANPQTILWRTEKATERKKVFDKGKAIADMRYEDFIEYAWVIHPVKDSEVHDKLFTNINPLDYKTDEEYKRVIGKISTNTERQQEKQIKEREAQIKDREAQIKEREAQIKERETQIKEREAQIKELTYSIQFFNCVHQKITFTELTVSLLQKYKNIAFQPWLKKKAFALCNAKHFTQAENIALSFIYNNPKISWAYYILGKCQWEQGLHKLALENVQKAIDLDPNIKYYQTYLNSRKPNQN